MGHYTNRKNDMYESHLAQPNTILEVVGSLEADGWSIVAIYPSPSFVYYTIIVRKKHKTKSKLDH